MLGKLYTIEEGDLKKKKKKNSDRWKVLMDQQLFVFEVKEEIRIKIFNISSKSRNLPNLNTKTNKKIDRIVALVHSKAMVLQN